MVTPDFIIAGAIKSGTTALYHYLIQHPDILLSSRQEPNYFAFMGQSVDFRGPGGRPAPINKTSVTTQAEYDSLYEAASGRCIGDISPVCLSWPPSVDNIRKHAPHAKVIIVLRNPVDRAFSSYMHLLRDAAEPAPSFRAALDAESERIRQNWGFLWRYVSVGRYVQALERYMASIPRENLKVVLFDELRDDANGTVLDILQFIGVDFSFEPNVGARYNASGIPRSRLLHNALNRQHFAKRAIKRLASEQQRYRLQALRANVAVKNLSRHQLPNRDRRFLIERLADEVTDLERLLGRPLGHWLVAE